MTERITNDELILSITKDLYNWSDVIPKEKKIGQGGKYKVRVIWFQGVFTYFYLYLYFL